MHVPMLLGEFWARMQCDMDFTVSDMDEFGAQGAHKPLGRKAGAYLAR